MIVMIMTLERNNNYISVSTIGAMPIIICKYLNVNNYREDSCDFSYRFLKLRNLGISRLAISSEKLSLPCISMMKPH